MLTVHGQYPAAPHPPARAVRRRGVKSEYQTSPPFLSPRAAVAIRLEAPLRARILPMDGGCEGASPRRDSYKLGQSPSCVALSLDTERIPSPRSLSKIEFFGEGGQRSRRTSTGF